MHRITPVLLALLVAAMVGLAWWLQRPSPTAPSPEVENQRASPVAPTAPAAHAKAQPFVPDAANSRPASLVPGGVKIVGDLVALARTLHAPQGSAREDLEILQTLLEFYRRANDGANPGGGLNEEFVEKLSGKNAKQFAVLPPDHPSIGPDGQLRDRWGTPYFFHPLSRAVLEIRSAGPDRRLFTSDDIELTPALETAR